MALGMRKYEKVHNNYASNWRSVVMAIAEKYQEMKLNRAVARGDFEVIVRYAKERHEDKAALVRTYDRLMSTSRAEGFEAAAKVAGFGGLGVASERDAAQKAFEGYAERLDLLVLSRPRGKTAATMNDVELAEHLLEMSRHYGLGQEAELKARRMIGMVSFANAMRMESE